MALRHITARDIEILKLMAEFGNKTFENVLIETFFNGYSNAKQQVRNRIDKLVNVHKIIRRVPTNSKNPSSILVLRDNAKEILKDIGVEYSDSFYLSNSTIEHNILEQIIYYFIRLSGRDIRRAIIAKWSKEQKHAHTPDLYYYNEKGGLVYVELEKSQKSKSNYLELFKKYNEDKVNAVLYVFQNEKKMEQITRVLPRNDILRVITIDELKKNILEENKIKAKKYDEYILEQAKKRENIFKNKPGESK